MRLWIAAAFAVGLIGCSDTPERAEEAPYHGPAPTVTESATVAKPAAAEQTNTDSRTGTNPSRINQLKDLKRVDLHALGHTIHCWIMDTDTKRQEGMMFLVDKDVRNDEGMIFAFSKVQQNDKDHGFWMHNCPLGLDIVYITPRKTVASIADGKPFNDTSLMAGAPYQYVLEMKTNCAKRLGIKAGTAIEIPDSVKSADSG